MYLDNPRLLWLYPRFYGESQSAHHIENVEFPATSWHRSFSYLYAINNRFRRSSVDFVRFFDIVECQHSLVVYIGADVMRRKMLKGIRTDEVPRW